MKTMRLKQGIPIVGQNITGVVLSTTYLERVEKLFDNLGLRHVAGETIIIACPTDLRASAILCIRFDPAGFLVGRRRS